MRNPLYFEGACVSFVAQTRRLSGANTLQNGCKLRLIRGDFACVACAKNPISFFHPTIHYFTISFLEFRDFVFPIITFR
jgi:hypothetical protein